jgi:hypothetical protein
MIFVGLILPLKLNITPVAILSTRRTIASLPIHRLQHPLRTRKPGSYFAVRSQESTTIGVSLYRVLNNPHAYVTVLVYLRPCKLRGTATPFRGSSPIAIPLMLLGPPSSEIELIPTMAGDPGLFSLVGNPGFLPKCECSQLVLQHTPLTPDVILKHGT